MGDPAPPRGTGRAAVRRRHPATATANTALGTAEAAKASIEAARDPEGRAGAWWIWPGIESIETPAEHTLVVNLSAPAALDLVAASTYAAWMVSPAALAAAAPFFLRRMP